MLKGSKSSQTGPNSFLVLIVRQPSQSPTPRTTTMGPDQTDIMAVPRVFIRANSVEMGLKSEMNVVLTCEYVPGTLVM